MWFLPESHLPGPEKTYGGKLVGRMSDGRRNNWKNIVWRSAIVSEIFFGQSVVIMIRNLNRIQKNMFIQNKRFCMRQWSRVPLHDILIRRNLACIWWKNYIFLLEKICFCLFRDFGIMKNQGKQMKESFNFVHMPITEMGLRWKQSVPLSWSDRKKIRF